MNHEGMPLLTNELCPAPAFFSLATGSADCMTALARLSMVAKYTECWLASIPDPLLSRVVGSVVLWWCTFTCNVVVPGLAGPNVVVIVGIRGYRHLYERCPR